jgi:hypothetical protein
MMGRVMSEVSVETLEKQLVGQRKMIELDDETDRPARIVKVEELEARLEEETENLEMWALVEWWVHGANTVLPKTGETIDLLIRVMEDKAGLIIPSPGNEDDDVRMFGGDVNRREFEQAVKKELDESHSATWILGTSLIFEACVLALGAFWFSRRDF